MKITDIKTHVMTVPGPDRKTTRRNWVFVEINTDAGLSGIGEATTEYHELAVKAQIESELKPRLIGLDPTDIEGIWQIGYRQFWWRRGIVHTSAMSGIDQALWDIAGKAANLPVYKMLGGKVRDQVRCYARPDFATGPVEDALSQAIEEGFDLFKHGLAPAVEPFDLNRQIAATVEVYGRLHDAAKGRAQLAIDCHGWLDSRSAAKLLDALERLDMAFVEEPMEQGTIEPYFRLKQNFPKISIAAGERWVTRWDCREWFERQAVDIAQIDVSHTGGISELMRIAAFAEVYNILVAPHNPYGPVALAASAHAAAAMPNFFALEHCRLRPWFDDVQVDPIPIRKGCVDISVLERRPGLGVELNMELVRAHSGHVPLQTLSYSLPGGSMPLI